MNQNILKRAILSEKVYSQIEHGIYTFLVSASATKEDIKRAIENQFSTKVLKVHVQTIPTKTKKVTGTRKSTQIGGGKKAIVFLQKGQKIALLSPKTEKTKDKDKKETKDKAKISDEKSKKEKKGLFSKFRKIDKEKKDKNSGK